MRRLISLGISSAIAAYGTRPLKIVESFRLVRSAILSVSLDGWHQPGAELYWMPMACWRRPASDMESWDEHNAFLSIKGFPDLARRLGMLDATAIVIGI